MAAPTMPAVLSNSAATTGVRLVSRGSHLSAFLLITPPAMNRSGQMAFSTATRTLLTSFVHRR